MSSPVPSNARSRRPFVATAVDLITRPFGILHRNGAGLVLITVSLLASLCFVLSALTFHIALNAHGCRALGPGDVPCRLSRMITVLMHIPWAPILATSWGATGVVGVMAGLRAHYAPSARRADVVSRRPIKSKGAVRSTLDALNDAPETLTAGPAEVAAADTRLKEVAASACEVIDAMRNVGLVPPLPQSRERRHEVAIQLLLGILSADAIDRALIDESSLRACAWDVVRHLESALDTVPTSHRVWPWR